MCCPRIFPPRYAGGTEESPTQKKVQNGNAKQTNYAKGFAKNIHMCENGKNTI
jgi:hypothetical protein